MADWAYLDHALRGPTPQSSLQQAHAVLELSARGSLSRAEQSETALSAREELSKLLGGWCRPSCLAFTTNTTSSLGLASQAVPWRPGDRVIVHADEVPANILPWQALAPRGVSVEVLPSRAGRLDLADLEGALRRPARVVSLAAVSLWTGQRRDLGAIGELTRSAGALLVVDAAQALGALELDLAGVDVVCGSSRKWLLGPPDMGIFAVRPGLEDELVVPAPGQFSLSPDGGWTAGGRRFEGGAVGAPLLAGLGGSCQLLRELGADWVEGRVLGLAKEVVQQGQSRGWEVVSPSVGPEVSGIVVLERAGLPLDLEERMQRAGVAVRVQGDTLRVSAHFWNTSEDVDRLFHALADVLDGEGRPPGARDI